MILSAIQPLTEGWRFRKSGDSDWAPAEVPGTVHSDLLRTGQIEDPFYRRNEADLQWVGESNWEYELRFEVAAPHLESERAEMVFSGLDTVATVRLNGTVILEGDNMFREWRVDARPHLQAGENILTVHFTSAITRGLELLQNNGMALPAGNDQAEEKVSVFVRKAPYHFGWDWGPRFVTSGIWRTIQIEYWSQCRIEAVALIPDVSEDSADLRVKVALQATKDLDCMVLVRARERNGSSAFTIKKRVSAKEGRNEFEITGSVFEPKLWWPVGFGDAYLYEVDVELKVGDATASSQSSKVGLRSVELRQSTEGTGSSFEFVINGEPVFARGANWIPADSFTDRVDEKRYRHLLSSAAKANMNMLRVWGGGIYEEDVFYDLCDELGIMVWQDFMFACSLYPGDETFLNNVEQEAVDNIRRLRSHPSIVLWCGNNEIEEGWHHWGWKDTYPSSVWTDYGKLFDELLATVCEREDPERPYRPSSPSSHPRPDPKEQEVGDLHYWGVWHKEEPFSSYTEQRPRFMSEFGFQSFPLLSTVETYTLPEDRTLDSEVMNWHQRHPKGNQLIRTYMDREYGVPGDFRQFLYLSQVQQAEGMKVGAEHLRTLKPYCMGSLYWQLNDCWPVASWSGIDYYGTWKALHHYARRFYAPVAVIPKLEEGALNWYVVNDTLKPYSGTLTVRLMSPSGGSYFDEEMPVEIGANESGVALSQTAKTLDKYRKKNRLFSSAVLVSEDGKEASNRFFFDPLKKLQIGQSDISIDAATTEDGVAITLSASTLAVSVCMEAPNVDGVFEDNFFDLIPGVPKTVKFLSDTVRDSDEVRNALTLTSVNDVLA